MYEKILIPTDGSELAEKAVHHGAKLAKHVGASVVIVTVTEMWSALDMAAKVDQGKTNPIELYEAAADKSASEILAAAKAISEATGVKTETVHIRDREPAEGIIETVGKHGCDLIVIASHGRRGIGRMLLGSQTAEVLAFAKVPVLVLR
jgi:nucleotide-binding universal stress UspA family protein